MRYLGVAAVAWLAMGCSVYAATQAAPGKESKSDPRLAILDKYMDAMQIQQAAMRGAHMDVDIDAHLPSLKKNGRLQALRMVSKLGKITYKALGFSGDNTVKQEVIARYLAAESEGRESGAIAITPANYKFRYAGRIQTADRNMLVVEITPRRKAIGLFKGQLWVDAESGMPYRESGQFVKSPSVFLKKIVFVRDYELHDGVTLPYRVQTTVDTRLIGKAELLIHFANYAKDEEASNAGEDNASNTGTTDASTTDASTMENTSAGAVAAVRAR